MQQTQYTDGISSCQMEEMKEAFDLFDMDGDKMINVKELGNVMRAMGQNPTQKDIAALMEKADTNGNQKLDYEEYVRLLQGSLKDPQIVKIELREAFRIFDKDRDQSLNFVELRKALTCLGDRLTDEEAIALTDMMDVNRDGRVDIDEFVAFMCQKN